MKSLDHIFQPKVTKRHLRKKASKNIKEEERRLNNLGVPREIAERGLNTFRFTEMKKVERGVLTGWEKVRGNQKNDMRKYLIHYNRLETLTIQNTNLILPRSVKSHEDFTRYVLRENMFSDIFIELQQYKEKRSFPCILFPGNWASVSKDGKGIYHYFTNRPEGISVSLNIFDLIEITCSREGQTFAYHRRKLIDILGCSYPEQKWEEKQFNKIRTNLNSIKNAKENWETQYPSLFKLTQSYLDILLTLNSYSEKYVNSKQFSYKKETLFFISSRYLANNLNRDPVNVRRAINMFACLRIIEKVPPDVQGFPHKFLQSAIRIRGGVTNNKLVTFFIIPKITKKLLKDAEIKAKKLLKNKISNINKLNGRKVAEIFDDDFAKSIYYAKEMDIDKLALKSGVDLTKCKQANTFITKREVERMKLRQGTYGDDVIPF
ncbi:hypothetical protein [Oceanobacillus picturae]|uniref:hypothetical protein n=1 Tax=Oceanobacillus picturae TaxID=171693 RepID=UPI00363676FC